MKLFSALVRFLSLFVDRSLRLFILLAKVSGNAQVTSPKRSFIKKEKISMLGALTRVLLAALIASSLLATVFQSPREPDRGL